MKEIKLTKGYTALVSDKEYTRVVAAGPWHANISHRTVYALHAFIVKGRHGALVLHRFILGITDSAIKVDHKDGNGLHCNRRNMRIASDEDNAHNRCLNKNSTSGYKGVHWNKQVQKWQATLGFKGRRIHLGLFTYAWTAAKAYDKAARKYFGRFAHTNF